MTTTAAIEVTALTRESFATLSVGDVIKFRYRRSASRKMSMAVTVTYVGVDSAYVVYPSGRTRRLTIYGHIEFASMSTTDH